MKKIFITGENGCIAKYLDRLLPKDKYDIVWGFSNKRDDICTFDTTWNEGKELDITNESILRDTLLERKPDIIINTAGIVDTVLCEKRPNDTIRSNIYGSYIVTKLCNEFNIKQVYFSTTAIYDPNDYDGKMIVEDTLIDPKTIYGQTKYCGEIITSYLSNPLVIRPCFIYGGIEDGHSGIARLIKSGILGTKETFLLDKNIRKDYMRIEDLVNAVTLLMDIDATGCYNISRGDPRYFGDIIEAVVKVTGLNIEYNIYPEMDYLKNHIVDNTKITRLGWRSIYSLEEGIKMSFEEIKSYYKC